MTLTLIEYVAKLSAMSSEEKQTWYIRMLISEMCPYHSLESVVTPEYYQLELDLKDRLQLEGNFRKTFLIPDGVSAEVFTLQCHKLFLQHLLNDPICTSS